MIDQVKPDVEEAKKLNQWLRLNEIELVELVGRRVGYVEDPTLSCATKLDEVKWSSTDELVICTYTIGVAIQHRTEAKDEREVLAFIRVQFRADYTAPKGFGGNELAIPHFLGIVGWMNVWPYMRAEVQQLSAKLGLPPLTLPLLLSGQTTNTPVTRISESDSVD